MIIKTHLKYPDLAIRSSNAANKYLYCHQDIRSYQHFKDVAQ